MYNKYLEVRQSNIGKGLFTRVEIPSNVPIMEFTGSVVTFKELPADSSSYLQIGVNTYITPVGAVNGVDFINHNCDPNCMVQSVGNRAILYSLYIIPANTELTFDYSTTSTDTLEMWKMDCTCGSNRCRRVISGYQYLDKSLQEEYKKKNAIPIFITNPIFQKR
jgi:hypothetical protein